MTEMTLQETREPKEEVTVTPAAPVQKMYILICYDAGDVKHLGDLDRHLQLMYRRLGSQVKRHYFCYGQVPEEPKPYRGDYPSLKEHYQKEKDGYEKQLEDYNRRHTTMLQFLQQDRLLIILYVSNALMERLWKDMEDSNLNHLLTNPNHRIAPVLITPTTGFAGNCEPLCAYDGVPFEVACQQITTNLETIARDYFGETLESPSVTPFTLLTSPTAINVSLPSATEHTAQMLAGLLSPIQTMLEQTNTRIVESQQLALAERSQEAELRKQLGEMEQRLTAHEIRQNASMGDKLRRLFRISSTN